MALNIGDILNRWANMGVFSYVLPFLLIFALVYGILEKSNILGKNKAVNGIVAGVAGLLALQFDIVPRFFASMFPGFGVGIAILLVALVFLGLFQKKEGDKNTLLYVIAFIIAAGVIYWTFSYTDFLGGGFGLSYWFRDYFWEIILLVIIGVVVYFMMRKKDESGGS